jgi:hypothetical protein
MDSTTYNANIHGKSIYTVILTILQYKQPWKVDIHSNTYNTNILGKLTYTVILTIQTTLVSRHTQ